MLTRFRFGQTSVQLDPKAEAKLRNKLDLYIVPTVSLLYLFCFIDRANIGKRTSTRCGAQLVPDNVLL